MSRLCVDTDSEYHDTDRRQRGEFCILRVLLFVCQRTESGADRQDAVDLQHVVEFETVPVLVHLPTSTF